jgi:hypothetical protein
MYALKVEEDFTGIKESINDSYNPSDGSFDEINDQLADQITTLAGQINAANYRFLKLIAEHYLASAGSNSDGSLKISSLKGAERCQLVMHIRADADNTGANNDASLDGRWLLPNAARRLACDASLLVVQEDDVATGLGNVLDIGRKY